MKTSDADEQMSEDDVAAALRLLLDIASQATPSQTLASAAGEIEGKPTSKRELKRVTSK